MEVMKRMNPAFAPFVNVPMAIVINGLQLLLCVIVLFVGVSNLAFSLSAAALLFINGLMHLGSAVRLKGYTPALSQGASSIYRYRFILSIASPSQGN